MVIDGYSMDLYCDDGVPGDGVHPWDMMENPQTFAGRTRGQCVRQARKLGWIINNKNECYCPACAKARRKKVTK